MKYSINPFKWLLWLWRKWEWRKYNEADGWREYYCHPKPLSRKGKAAIVDEMKAAHEKTVFVRPKSARRSKAEIVKEIRAATERGYWGVHPNWVVEFCFAHGEPTDAEVTEVVQYHNRRREERKKVFPHFEKLDDNYGNK